MNKKAVYLGSVAVLSSLLAFHSFSKQESLNTVEKCSSLLPSGYNFSMTIEANIDTANGQASMSGDLHLTDGTQDRNPELSAKVEPFKQCVIRLMK
ncbi:hypothetical protein [Aliiglaciecola litoralis]|uniref:Secreted protein n=1 Tax=Aliiglaciecola litoralis TaxID=582857 RepID=A0ABN1LDY0_9ALTE